MSDITRQKTEFDHYADQYNSLHAQNIRITGEEPAYFAEYKVRETRRALGDSRIDSILDFGAGIGASTPYFHQYFPDSRLTGIDVSADSLDIARREHGAISDFQVFDGKKIPASEGSFDLAFTACVFHHIPADEHVGALAEIRRVLKPEGEFFIFEHNPLNPLTRHAVNTCPFDENAVLIRSGEMKRRILAAGFSRAEINFCVFFPAMLGALRGLERYMGWLPLGAQYYIRAAR